MVRSGRSAGRARPSRRPARDVTLPRAFLAWPLAILLLPAGSSATTITIAVFDAPGEGFNDNTQVLPVGGNPGTTLGAQRLAVFEHAASIWASTVKSTVEIRISAGFDPMECDDSSALLGFAGPETVHRDFAGAPRPMTWYTQALANSLAGVDLAPDIDDMFMAFNSRIGFDCPFPSNWYYGLDGVPPSGETDLVTVVLHEMGHGLGFLTLVDAALGTRFRRFNDAFMFGLENHLSGRLFPAMTNAERAAASIDTGNLHWVGETVIAAGSGLIAGREPLSGHVEMYAPDPVEPGSSVSHFSPRLSPNDLMEPFYTGAVHDPGLAGDLLVDLGWVSVSCGDGVVAGGEECDDGNEDDGDGCTRCRVDPCFRCAGQPSVCMPDDGTVCDDGNPCTTADRCSSGMCTGTPNDGVPCEDGDPCTRDDRCEAGTCRGDATPRTDCKQPVKAGKAFLLLKNGAIPAKDKLIWKWINGEETRSIEFGSPHRDTDYLLCAYDPSGVIMSREVSAGDSWRALGDGFKYRDRFGGEAGVTLIRLKEGSRGSAKILVKGKGAGLDVPDLDALTSPVTVQLGNPSGCWEATYGTRVLKAEPAEFKAKAD
jgi:cysteine-rich repeat protein